MVAAVWGEVPTPEDSGHGSMVDRFVVPPFSVLDTRQGYWQTRRRWWLALGIQSEIGRGALGTEGGTVGAIPMSGSAGEFNRQMRGAARSFREDLMRHEVLIDRSGLNGLGQLQNPKYQYAADYSPAPGVSIFDPVLCELAYRWWCPEGGTVLDPFAGGSVRGIVAAYLGHPYIGIDLSARQVEANREQAQRILAAGQPVPTWHAGESFETMAGIPGEVDLVFSCPPYYDLEVYSDEPGDLSAMPRYVDFLEAYRRIIERACSKLRDGRFAVFVVSEIRGPDGTYRGLVPDTIEAFRAAGMRYYNDAVLLNAVGSLPLRAGVYFEASRKIGRGHQNVLCFLKGDHPRGWSYERPAPPDPQLSWFVDEPDDDEAHDAPDVDPWGDLDAVAVPEEGVWTCDECEKQVPNGPIRPQSDRLYRGPCYGCDDVTTWHRAPAV